MVINHRQMIIQMLNPGEHIRESVAQTAEDRGAIDHCHGAECCGKFFETKELTNSNPPVSILDRG